jgi:Amt family ammonium transporter
MVALGWGIVGILTPALAQPAVDASARKDVQLLRDRMDAHQQGLTTLRQSAEESKHRVSSIEEENRAFGARLQTHTKSIAALTESSGNNNRDLNRFWLLLAAVLVFFMQAGFKCLEVGMVRTQHGATTAMKNLMDWLVLCSVYYLVGFGLMFGKSVGGLVGTTLFMPNAGSVEAINPQLGLEFFLFQLAFAGTSATIVSGAMAERTAMIPYFLVALFVGTAIYPVFGHWAWSGALEPTGSPTGWLQRLGFLDFAGSTVVHSVGAWVALVGVLFLGPRRFRFRPEDDAGARFRPHNLAYSILGVFMLWFGWWGFNGGSQLRYDTNISSIILNTNLAAAFSGITAYFHALATSKDYLYEKMIGGVLGGLVAITASCNIVQPPAAITIGIIAALIHNYGFDLLVRCKLDDPVGAIPVHGFCGIWGTLAVAAFGHITRPRSEQLVIQLIGIGAAFLYTVIIAGVFFFLLTRIIGIRVSASEEDTGFVGGRSKRLASAQGSGD